MAGLLDWYNYVVYDLADRRSDEHWLMNSPIPMLCIAISYLLFVNVVGPRFMKNRPAFKLDTIIQGYNLLQIALCTYLLISIHKIRKYNVIFFCEAPNYSTTEEGLETSRLSWFYFMLKLVDLSDTVFFILRKKFSQVTFLHVYHHAMMFVFVWGIVRYVPGGHGSIVGYINSYVHILMYGYYFVTNRWPEYKKNLWWKKYITTVQIVQFLIIFVATVPLLFMSCPYPNIMTYLILIQNGMMLKMFTDFYRKAYMSKKDK
uniref:Elongation of very long chain fatty acids protein n=1 Tax=Blattella germanica TaxID=6973 RepID=A0A8F7CH80_BLAGE|nr:fatty acid elongase 24 [Blattella germanica]